MDNHWVVKVAQGTRSSDVCLTDDAATVLAYRCATVLASPSRSKMRRTTYRRRFQLTDLLLEGLSRVKYVPSLCFAHALIKPAHCNPAGQRQATAWRRRMWQTL